MPSETEIAAELYDEYLATDLYPATKKTDRKLRERISFIDKEHGDSYEPSFFHTMGLYAYGLSKWTKYDRAFMELNFMRSYVFSGRRNIGAGRYLCFVLYDCKKYKSLISFYDKNMRENRFKDAHDTHGGREGHLLVRGLYICALIQAKEPERKIIAEIDRWMRKFDRYDKEGGPCDGAVPMDFLTQIRKLSNRSKVKKYVEKLADHAWDA